MPTYLGTCIFMRFSLLECFPEEPSFISGSINCCAQSLTMLGRTALFFLGLCCLSTAPGHTKRKSNPSFHAGDWPEPLMAKFENV